MTEDTQDDIDIGDAFAEPSEETEEAEEIEATEESTDETGEPEESDESEDSEESGSPPQQQHVPIAALTAERRKRQEAEKKLEELENDLPDPVENPKEFAEHVKNASEASRVQDRINLSRDILMDTDPNYLTYEQEFMNAVAKTETGEDGQPNVSIVNQDLYNQFMASSNPARFARDMGKDIKTLRERMDPNYEQKLREKWEAEKLDVEVPDLTEATESNSNSEPVETPADLSNVFDGSPL